MYALIWNDFDYESVQETLLGVYANEELAREASWDFKIARQRQQWGWDERRHSFEIIGPIAMNSFTDIAIDLMQP